MAGIIPKKIPVKTETNVEMAKMDGVIIGVIEIYPRPQLPISSRSRHQSNHHQCDKRCFH